MEFVRHHGYPVPAVEELSGDGSDLVLERIDGLSMVEELRRTTVDGSSPGRDPLRAAPPAPPDTRPTLPRRRRRWGRATASCTWTSTRSTSWSGRRARWSSTGRTPRQGTPRSTWPWPGSSYGPASSPTGSGPQRSRARCGRSCSEGSSSAADRFAVKAVAPAVVDWKARRPAPLRPRTTRHAPGGDETLDTVRTPPAAGCPPSPVSARPGRWVADPPRLAAGDGPCAGGPTRKLEAMESTPLPVLVYDGDCGFCTAWARRATMSWTAGHAWSPGSSSETTVSPSWD